ncbi:MAG: CcdB family protein [Spirochaetaceae bacterium]
MPQFDIHENANASSRKHTPYLLNVQADVLSELVTRVVIPLRAKKGREETVISRLHPVIPVAGVDYIAVVTEMAAIQTSQLGRRVDAAQARRTEITAALDLLLTGF